MEERSDIKTIMCSVLFLDIVEYSRKSVAGQISLKDRFNNYLSAALRDVPMTDRIIFDTGDGAVINFLGDIEDALRVALSLRESLLSEYTNLELPLLVHMGVNLGPVRLVRDVNGQPNIVGDGINVAQRIMGFADANQILVSRTYYDAVLRLSGQYAGMFYYQGSRTDKHVREHELFAIGYPGDETAQQTSGNNIAEQATDHHADALGNVKLPQNLAASKQAESSQRTMYIGVAVLVMALVGALALKLNHHDEMPVLPKVDPMQAVSGVRQAPTVVSAVSASSRAEDKTAEASMVQAAINLKPNTGKTVESKPDKKKVVESRSDSKKINDQIKHAGAQLKAHSQVPEAINKHTPAAAADSSAEKSTEAYIAITCDEGTRVFVDGMQKGKLGSGALTLAILPGKHLVIVNHPSGNIYSRNVDLELGKTLRIRPNICK